MAGRAGCPLVSWGKRLQFPETGKKLIYHWTAWQSPLLHHSKEVCNNTNLLSPVNVILISALFTGHSTIVVSPGLICLLVCRSFTFIFNKRASLAGFHTIVAALVFPFGMLHQNVPSPILLPALSGSGI